MKNGWDTQHSVNWESLVALGIQSIGIINGEKWVQFHRTGKGRFSFQSQSKAMPRNVQNFHTVALVWHISKVMLKILQARLNSMWTVIFQMFKLDLVKAKEWDQIANICWITEKATDFQKNLYFGFIDYTKAFDCVDHNRLWKNSQRVGNTRPPYLPPEKSVCRSRSNS